MCSKLKIKAVCHRSDVFIVDFDHSQHINIVFILLTLNKYLSVGCERKSYEQVFVKESHNVLERQKAIYLFCNKCYKAYLIH